MTLIDVLEVLPAKDPKRPQVIAILRDLIRGWQSIKTRKPASGIR